MTLIVIVALVSVPVVAQPTHVSLWEGDISVEHYHPLAEFVIEEEVVEEPQRPQYFNGQILEQYRHVNRMTFWFTAGYCTSYAASQRPDLFDGSKYGSLRGNARHRLSRAQALGMSTGTVPQAWAIAVYMPGNGISRYGHVAYVQEVLDDGLIIVRDMNYRGRYVVTTRVESASAAAWYIYD